MHLRAGLRIGQGQGFVAAAVDPEFQSIGLRHPRYTPLLAGLGKAFSVVVPVLFSAIVVFLYLTQA